MLLDQSSYLEFCYFFQKVSDGIYLRDELKKGLKLSKFMATVYFILFLWIYSLFKNCLMLNNILITVKGQNVALNLIRRL